MARGLASLLGGACLLAVGCFRAPEPVPGAHGYASGVTTRQILKTGVAADGKPLLPTRPGVPELTVLEVNLAPGARTGWHLHPVPVFAFVQEGDLTVELADGTLKTYAPGQALAEALEATHEGRNLGKTPVKLVVFYHGTQGVPNVVKQAPPVRPGTPAVP